MVSPSGVMARSMADRHRIDNLHTSPVTGGSSRCPVMRFSVHSFYVHVRHPGRDGPVSCARTPAAAWRPCPQHARDQPNGAVPATPIELIVSPGEPLVRLLLGPVWRTGSTSPEFAGCGWPASASLAGLAAGPRRDWRPASRDGRSEIGRQPREELGTDPRGIGGGPDGQGWAAGLGGLTVERARGLTAGAGRHNLRPLLRKVY